MPNDVEPQAQCSEPGAARLAEVFGVFLKLGLTSFGGPVAHLGYFRTEFVERRKWLDDRRYADLVALCQFLPGPASSQVGMGLGLGRAGWMGAMAAWLGFTLPSALALILFALGLAVWPGIAQSGLIHGLKVMAVAVVAQAVWGMVKSLCTDGLRRLIAVGSATLLLLVSSPFAQIGVIAVGGIIGWRLLLLDNLPPTEHPDYGVSRTSGRRLLILFGVLLLALPVLDALSGSYTVSAISGFYQSGALVFGGGHVVLPLLQANVVPPGWVSNDTFLAGYGAAQAVPGPLFTLAAFLGASMPVPLGGWGGGITLLIAVFLPSFLLLAGALPYWEVLRQRDGIRRAMGGINAAVVGVLAAALYDPVWTSAIHSLADFALALLAYLLLVFGKVSPVLVIALAVFAGALLG